MKLHVDATLVVKKNMKIKIKSKEGKNTLKLGKREKYPHRLMGVKKLVPSVFRFRTISKLQMKKGKIDRN